MSEPQAARRGTAVPSPRSAASCVSALPSLADDVPVPPCGDHEFREDVGAYVLGALDDDQTRRFELHAAGCPACSHGLEELLTVRALLDSVDPQLVIPSR